MTTITKPDLSNDMDVSRHDDGRKPTVHIKETFNDGSQRSHIVDIEMAEFLRDALSVIYNENTTIETVHHTEDERKVDATVGTDSGVYCVLKIHNDGSRKWKIFTEKEATQILSGLRDVL